MADLLIPYELTGPDGTRAVVGNSEEARSDPDFCGYLEAETGVTGLLDGAEIRESASNLVEADGATHGPFFLGRRPGTINGFFPPDLLDMGQINLLQQKLDRATNALRGDCVMRWTPTGSSIQRQLRLRRQQTPQWPGRIPKRFQLAMVAADARILSSSEASVVLTPGASSGELGVQDPATDPLTSELNVTAQQFVVNQGTDSTWPRFRIEGPITNPVLLNATTGQQIWLVYTLIAGEWLDVYPQRGVILLGGTADRYAAYDASQSDWWQLAAGTNDVRLLAAAHSAGAQATVMWRHAWNV